MFFFINQPFKPIIITFPLDLTSLFLYQFFYCNLSLICALQFFSINFSKNLFSSRIFYYIHPWHSIFNCCSHKNVFRLTWSITFHKNVFILWYPHMITNFKVRILIIILHTKIIKCTRFYSNRTHFNSSVISFIYSNLSKYTFLDIEMIYISRFYSLKFQ